MTVKKADFQDTFQLSPHGSDYNLSQMADDEVLLELEEPNMDEEMVLVMDEDALARMLPGSNVPMMKDDQEEEELPKDWEHDKDHGYFIVYMQNKLDEVPSWSGTTTVGCEKAISYLRRLDKELSEAIRGDEDNKIDEQEAEGLRDTIYDYIARLEDAHDQLMGKYKKKAQLCVGKKVVARIKDGKDIQYFMSVATPDGEETLLKVEVVEPSDEQVAQFVEGEKLKGGLHKEAGAGIVLFEDPFLHSITRLLIQSHITHGRDMNEIYGELKGKYEFTPREELSIHELLHQKGFPLIKDLGRLGEDKVLPQEGLGVNHHTEYYS
jgi:hypothetical protein